MTYQPFLSKSKYLSGLQCHKLLWHYYNAKEEIPQVDAGTQAIFNQGILVGKYAKQLFFNGVEIQAKHFEMDKTLKDSREALKLRKPLFEGGFKYRNAFARADILNPVAKDAWDIIEVKSSTEVKEINLHDLALQWYTYQGAGLDINRCHILHINKEYIRKRDVDSQKLFILEDVTKDVKKFLPDVEGMLEEMVKVIAAKRYPEIAIGLHCSDPYDCPLQEKCFKFLPTHNPLTLYYLKKEKAFGLINDGVTDILKLNDSIALSDKQKIQIQSLRSKLEFVDKKGIRSFLETLDYPLYYLDFETMGTAIPLFDDVKPYQQIPFQFSLHIQESPKSKIEHIGYLAEGKEDPRPELLKLLKKHLGNKGSIIAYNASFEKGRLKESAEVFSSYKDWIQKIQGRIIDLLDPFKAFYYYHYKQEGSASLKAVLPVLTGKGYEGMEIADGGTASNEYLRVTFGDVDALDRRRVREQLEKYCGQDTLGMVWIIDKLRELVA